MELAALIVLTIFISFIAAYITIKLIKNYTQLRIMSKIVLTIIDIGLIAITVNMIIGILNLF